MALREGGRSAAYSKAPFTFPGTSHSWTSWSKDPLRKRSTAPRSGPALQLHNLKLTASRRAANGRTQPVAARVRDQSSLGKVDVHGRIATAGRIIHDDSSAIQRGVQVQGEY